MKKFLFSIAFITAFNVAYTQSITNVKSPYSSTDATCINTSTPKNVTFSFDGLKTTEVFIVYADGVSDDALGETFEIGRDTLSTPAGSGTDSIIKVALQNDMGLSKKYTIRVVSSGGTVGTNSTEFTAIGKAAIVSVNSNDITPEVLDNPYQITLCVGDELTLESFNKGDGGAYEWFIDGVTTSVGNRQTYTETFASAGTFTYYEQSGTCSTISNEVEVTVVDVPVSAFTITSVPASCSKKLVATSTSNPDSYTYEWYTVGESDTSVDADSLVGKGKEYFFKEQGTHIYALRTIVNENGCDDVTGASNTTIGTNASTDTLSKSVTVGFIAKILDKGRQYVCLEDDENNTDKYKATVTLNAFLNLDLPGKTQAFTGLTYSLRRSNTYSGTYETVTTSTPIVSGTAITDIELTDNLTNIDDPTTFYYKVWVSDNNTPACTRVSDPIEVVLETADTLKVKSQAGCDGDVVTLQLSIPDLNLTDIKWYNKNYKDTPLNITDNFVDDIGDNYIKIIVNDDSKSPDDLAKKYSVTYSVADTTSRACINFGNGIGGISVAKLTQPKPTINDGAYVAYVCTNDAGATTTLSISSGIDDGSLQTNETVSLELVNSAGNIVWSNPDPNPAVNNFTATDISVGIGTYTLTATDTIKDFEGSCVESTTIEVKALPDNTNKPATMFYVDNDGNTVKLTNDTDTLELGFCDNKATIKIKHPNIDDLNKYGISQIGLWKDGIFTDVSSILPPSITDTTEFSITEDGTYYLAMLYKGCEPNGPPSGNKPLGYPYTLYNPIEINIYDVEDDTPITNETTSDYSETIENNRLEVCTTKTTGDITLSTKYKNTTDYTWQWYSKEKKDDVFSVITDSTRATLIIPLKEQSSKYYKVLITSAKGSDDSTKCIKYSDSLQVIVNIPPVNPVAFVYGEGKIDSPPGQGVLTSTNDDTDNNVISVCSGKTVLLRVIGEENQELKKEGEINEMHSYFWYKIRKPGEKNTIPKEFYKLNSNYDLEITVNDTMAGDYILKVKAGSCDTIVSKTLTIKSIPSPNSIISYSYNGEDIEVTEADNEVTDCSSDRNINMILKSDMSTILEGNNTYKWEKVGLNELFDGSATISTIKESSTDDTLTITSEGKYRLILTTSDGSACSDTSAVAHVKIPPADVTFSVNEISGCRGSKDILIAAVSTGYDYSWYIGNSPDSIKISTDDNYTESVIPSTTNTGANTDIDTLKLTITINEATEGEYTLISKYGKCEKKATANVILNPTPTPIIDNGVDSIATTYYKDIIACDSIVLTSVNSTALSPIYKWYKGDGTTFTELKDGNSASYTVRASGTYYLEIENGGGINCSATSPKVKITVTNLPNSILQETLTACDDLTLSQKNNSSYTYIWYKDGKVDTTTTTNEYKIVAPGVYKLETKIKNSICSVMSEEVELMTFPIKATIDIPVANNGEIKICEDANNTLKLTSLDVSKSYNYAWYKDDVALTTASATTPTLELPRIPASNGKYKLELKRGATCTSTSDFVTVDIATAPISVITGEQNTYCKGDTIVLKSKEKDASWSYMWFLENKNVGEKDSLTVVLSDKTKGKYTLEIDKKGYKCYIVSNEVNISYKDVNAGIEEYKKEVAYGKTFDFVAYGGVKYEWYNKTFLLHKGTKEDSILTVTPTQDINYLLQITNRDSCVTLDTLQVKIRGLKAIDLPNTITPNGDGKNDTWQLPKGLKNVTVTVFNRQGGIVMKREKYNNDWSGDNLPAGTYYYIVEQENGSKVTGFITILK